MTRAALRRWFWVHKWSSLVCTAFLLLICITGLPLVFNEEIAGWLNDDPPYAVLAADTAGVSLDQIVSSSRQLYQNQIITSIFIDDDEPQVVVSMAPSWAALGENPKLEHWIKFDGRTGQVLKQSQQLGKQTQDFLEIVLGLHKNLFAGLAGELFLATMALLFLAAIISGVLLYSPFMRKLNFGTVRKTRSPRLKWLDLHNLLGIVTLAWTLVVGATGLINELSTPLFSLWQRTDVREMLESWNKQPAVESDKLSSIQGALDTAKAALPGMTVTTVIFPGSEFGTPYHYVFWAKGQEPLTSRLFSPALVDARSGKLSGVLAMPWYLQALEISRPLHFGDYGGLPLKIIWALLDLVTIMVLGSGIYLWIARRSSSVESDFTESERDTRILSPLQRSPNE